MPSDQIVSSVAEAAASAVRLMTGLETYRSFKLDSATSVADGIPPTNHDDIAHPHIATPTLIQWSAMPKLSGRSV